MATMPKIKATSSGKAEAVLSRVFRHLASDPGLTPEEKAQAEAQAAKAMRRAQVLRKLAQNRPGPAK